VAEVGWGRNGAVVKGCPNAGQGKEGVEQRYPGNQRRRCALRGSHWSATYVNPASSLGEVPGAASDANCYGTR